MTLSSFLSAIRTGMQTQFFPIGGVAPFSYEVLEGGAGGTINSEGLYTAPNIYGVDTIRVTDSSPDPDDPLEILPLVAEHSIGIMGPSQLVCDILQKELGLANGQVYFYNQKINIPKDDKMYIAVGVLSSKIFGNTNRFVDGVSKQSVNSRVALSIDIMSRSSIAFDRKEEVLMALNSDYAKVMQSANNFYIARLPENCNNLSEEDGAAIPYRFNFAIGIQYTVNKTSNVAYYEEFKNEVIDNDK